MLYEMPYEWNVQDRQLGCTSFAVFASVAARSPARSVSFVPTLSAGIPRFARALLIHLTSSPSMYVAVDAFVGAGCAIGPAARPTKARSRAASRMLARAGRGERAGMACI